MRKFTKYDSGKPRLDLVPPLAIELTGAGLGHGARKYASRNWEKCPDPDRFVAAALRHLYKHLSGRPVDDDSGLLHLSLAACDVLFALDLWARMEHTGKVTAGRERNEFHYFAVVEVKPRAKRGRILKRANTYESAWRWLSKDSPTPELCKILTIDRSKRVGDRVAL